MRARIHRGANQIGGTCIELEYDEVRLALDMGLPLDGDASDASLLPAIAGPGLAGVLISHPHIDHYGLVHHLPPHTPIGMGAAARRIVQAAAPFTGQPLPQLDGYTLRDRETLTIGPFRVTPFLVDHSAFDAYALLIEAGGKRVFYSGDFRGHGRKGSLFEAMINSPPRDIDVLFMEGSSLSRLSGQERFPTESELEEQLVASLAESPCFVMVHTSAQNIDRVVTLYRIAKRTGRTLVLDLYSAAILEATMHPSIPKSHWPKVALFVPQLQRQQIKREGWFELLRDHSSQRIFAEDLAKLGPEALLLYRPLHMVDLEKSGCLAGARFIYSQWRGYLERGSYASTQRWLKRHGIEIEYCHTSGHAPPVDLQRFANAIAPKTLVPVHSFAPEQYAGLFDNVEVKRDGEWWNV